MRNFKETVMNSEIEHRERARQIVDFKGIRLGEKEMPTDCDGLIEWHNKAYVFFELKGCGKEIPFGQKLAFTRMCDDFNCLKKPAVFIIAEHDVDNPEVDIDAAKTSVREFYFKGRWYRGRSNLKELIDRFISFVDRRQKF